MKKIISLLSVFALICTMFTTIAFADENNDFYFTESKNGNEVTLTLYGKTNYTVIQLAATIDIANALNNGATVKSFEALNGLTFNVNPTAKVISCTYMDTSASTGQTGVFEFGKVTFDISNLTQDTSFAQKRAVVAKQLGGTNIASNFSASAYSYVLKAPADDPAPTPTVTPAVAGKEIENGYKTFSAPAPAVLATSAENLITVTKSGDTERKLTHTLPAGVAGGKTKVLPIVSYKLGVNGVNAADVFTITITSGSDTIATYTYTAQ